MLKRFTTDFTVVAAEMIDCEYVLLTLKHPEQLPEINAGQFVEVKLPDSATSFLRRPISIHDVNRDNQTLQLLIRVVGNGTKLLSLLTIGDKLNLVYPLGNGFSLDKAGNRPLLVGGGVGVAPMLYLGKRLVEMGAQPEFLFGARNKSGLLRLAEFEKIAKVNITTEDGSVGTKGFVTNHSAIESNIANYSSLLVCGPMPMMKAVAAKAKAAGVRCEVSLENKMACGIGVCLCCVTETKEGHKCVCSQGPVFEINELKW
ncbi:MAG: dihydroorotate dehydrogenase electron transfer subunit [Salinivirgaceae bacterium]|nr:dihydroorotate dehydrogenase electron transfer subunit [Salinivirgaceae bacterium]